MTSQSVRLATWNILHALNYVSGRDDLEGVIAAVRAIDADVIGLQEVDREQPRSGALHQAEAIAEALGYAVAFAPTLHGHPDTAWTAAGEQDPGGPAYGIAVLSRSGIDAVRRVRLPGGGDGHRSPRATPTRPGWDREPRWALQTKVPCGNRHLTVTCVHLSYMPWRSIRQLGRVLPLAAPDGGPAVLLGDFNLPARPLAARARGWRTAGGAKTHPSPAPRLQLDHILVRGLAVTNVRVGEMGPSDHLPLIAEATLSAG